jgi:2-dehydro-3-deoxyphosphogluconate aldolase/(4S)-4-hydroxy-2-oxoglutarate aldolase
VSLTENAAHFAKIRVLPVLTPISTASGTAISRVLFDAGLRMQEVTLRTQSGLDTIAALKQELPDLIVGAGSVLTPEMGEAAIHAGAHFLVSPGMNEVLLRFAGQCSVPFLPGVATVSEVMRVQDVGCTAVKLFPAETLGGMSFLQSVAGPLPSMKFCPTGGIDVGLAQGYLQLPNVLAVGGSWMAPNDLIRENRFDDIRRLAEQAAALR